MAARLTAKLTALLCGSTEALDEPGASVTPGPRLPLCLVPITAGTGSRSRRSRSSPSGQEKRGVSSPFILPDIAVLDAELTLGLPPAITAATGIDAMVHAIEAYTSKNANNNPLSKMLAREALRLIGANIETAVFDGSDLEARSAMLLGSMLAGQAFANSPVAAVHALAYPIGGSFHVPHGLSNALVLPHVLRFNMVEASMLYAEIAADAFPALAPDEGSQARGAAFVDALASLSARLGLKQRLRDVGIGRSICRSSRRRHEADAPAGQQSAHVGEADALDIYEAAW